MSEAPTLVWFRRDLRLADQAALAAACAGGGAVIPVYVHDDESARHRAPGGASRWWLHGSLVALDADLRRRGSRLVCRSGRAEVVLAALAEETGARVVHAVAAVEPWLRNAERAVGKRLDLRLHAGNYLAPPLSVRTGGGTPYRIYTPFWRALRELMPPPAPLPAPARIAAPAAWPVGDDLDDWHLLPTHPDWAGGLRAEWTPGEAGAQARLGDFLDHAARYADERNLPAREGTSRLSPHLAFGEISAGAVWHALAGRQGEGVDTFRGELGWRDFAGNVIAEFPDFGARSARAAYDAMPWREGAEAEADLAAWQRGQTGWPIVDAGMRQLWDSGWMHNRVRMLVASFLVKHLLIDWRRGEQWFWDTLVDADYAQNTVNWQWVAGSGHDASLFARIMAPLSQSVKFDAGGYIRRWVPELAGLSDADIHDPAGDFRARLGYPAMRVSHAEGRARALAAWARVKSA